MLPIRTGSIISGGSNNVAIIPIKQSSALNRIVISKHADLSQLRDSGFLSDITLEIPGVKRYPVHKNILAISSEYFKTLFSGRFQTSTVIKLDEVSVSTLDLYLDMIYDKELIIYGWCEIMKLLEFAKFTQTTIPRQDEIIKAIKFSAEDFVGYIQVLSDFYENEIPIETISSIDIPLYNSAKTAPYVDGINFSDLGEDFTKALIKTRRDGDIKYLIAQKAVSEGMSTDLYGLVDTERIRTLTITPESFPYLRRVDMNLLTNSYDLIDDTEFIVLVDEYMGIETVYCNIKYMIFTAKTKDNKRVILVIDVEQCDDFQDKYVAISKDHTEQDIDRIMKATIIKVKEFYRDTALNYFYYQISKPDDIGPLFIDKYELL